jgi:hypothetical protein
MRASPHSRSRLWVLVFATALTAGCVLFLDRRVADWSALHFAGSPAFRASQVLLSVVDLSAIAIVAVAVVAALWHRLSPPAPRWARQFARAGLALALSLTLALVLKYALGRAQVSPVYLQYHQCGFFPFHGGRDYLAFPSATMMGATATWIGWGPGRRSSLGLAIATLAILGAALIVTNSHWLGDIVAGVYLGLFVGAAGPRIAHAKPRTVAA